MLYLPCYDCIENFLSISGILSIVLATYELFLFYFDGDFGGLDRGDPIYVKLPLKLISDNKLGFFYITDRSSADISNY